MPPMNIDASLCTVRTGLDSANQRSPGASITRACLSSASGPITRERSAPARAARTCSTRSSSAAGTRPVCTEGTETFDMPEAYGRRSHLRHYACHMADEGSADTGRRIPRWVPRAVVLFWLGALGALVTRYVFNRLSGFLILLLLSLFMALAIEPGANKLEARGWQRGRATLSILLAVVVVAIAFLGIVGTLVGQQLADLARNSSTYVNDTVKFVNDTFNANIDPAQVNARIADPNGAVQKFIAGQQDKVLNLSVQALNMLFQSFTVLLFSFYLVADGPRLRRSICSRLPAPRQRRVLDTWDLAITKTGGYLYSRLLLAGLSAFFHWVALQAIGTPAPIAMALWVGLVSQFLPVIGTYLAGVLPALLTFLNSPGRALVVIGFILV